MKIGNFEINKKIFITFIVIVVLTIIALILKKIYVKEYEDYKINKDKEFIYTYETYSNSVTEVPFVNIDTNFARELNDKLQELASTYKNSNTSNNSMDYRYNINDNIVSLVIVFKSIDSNNHLIFNYKTYVFDLDQEGRALTDEEILKKYGKTVDEVNDNISLQMVKKYNDEIGQKIIPGTCNYKDCYLKLRNVEKYTDNANYYIEDGWLVVYAPYNIYSEYNEDKYFSRDDFKFYIVQNEKK